MVSSIEIGPLSYQLTSEQRRRWLGTLESTDSCTYFCFEPSGAYLQTFHMKDLIDLMHSLDPREVPNRTAILRSEQE